MPLVPEREPSASTWPPRPREVVLACLLLAALFVLSHSRSLPPGKVLSAEDIVLHGLPFSKEAAPEHARAQNEALWDQTLAYAPWFVLASKELRDGRFPLWNPHAGCGTVLAANDQSEVFLPPMLAALLLGPAWGLFLLALAKHVAAGLGAHLFLRARGLGIHAGLAAGVAWAFSGPFVVWEGYPVSTVAACLGWALLAVERSAQVGRGAWPSGALALAVAAGLLSGFVQTFFHCALAVAIYALARAWQVSREKDNREAAFFLARLALGSALGVFLAAPHVLLFLGELLRSEALARRREHSVQADVPLRFLAQLFFIDMEGSPRDGSFYASARTGSYIELTEGSIGAAGLLLAFVAAFSSRREGPTRLAHGALILAWLGLGLVHGGGLVKIGLVLPFSLARNYRLAVPVAFGLAVAAGCGVDLLLRSRASLGRAVAGYGVALLAALVTVWLARDAASVQEPLAGKVDALARPFRGPELSLGAPILAALAALSVAWAQSRRAFPRVAGGALLVLVIAIEQALIFAWDWNPGVKAERFFPESATMNALKASPEGDRPRTLALGDLRALPPNVPTAYGVDAVSRYDVLGSLAFKPLRDALGKTSDPDLECFQTFSPKIARLLGVRYVLVGAPTTDPRVLWQEPAPRGPGEGFGIAPLSSDSCQGETFAVESDDLTQVQVHAHLAWTEHAKIELVVSALVESGLEELQRKTAPCERRSPKVWSALFVLDPIPGKRTLAIQFRRADEGPGRVSLYFYANQREWVRRFDGRAQAPGALACSVASTSPIASIYTALPLKTTVLEDRETLPRVRWTCGARVVPSVEAAVSALREPGHDPRASVVLLADEAPSGAGSSPVKERGEARIARYGASEVEVSVKAPGPGYVVLADAWHPDWKVTVDGAPAKLLRGDAALRAVALPAGEHLVRFRYAPAALPLGVALATFALVVVLLGPIFRNARAAPRR
ncbi:hypothetical protein HY251_17785 [bacterium]|nr:hypothetical protein [bacterium]